MTIIRYAGLKYQNHVAFFDARGALVPGAAGEGGVAAGGGGAEADGALQHGGFEEQAAVRRGEAQVLTKTVQQGFR
jgi:hypothetical protein